MLVGVDIKKRIEYVSPKDSDPKTVFVLKPMTGSEMIDLSMLSNGKEIKLSREYINILLERSIVEIRDFKSSNGEVVNTSEKEKIKLVMDEIPVMVLGDLALEITRINGLTEDDKKNS